MGSNVIQGQGETQLQVFWRRLARKAEERRQRLALSRLELSLSLSARLSCSVNDSGRRQRIVEGSR
jgi:hypothetical protein